MITKALPKTPSLRSRFGFVHRVLRGRVLAQLERIHTGQLHIVDPCGEHEFGQTGDTSLVSHVHVTDLRFYRHVALGGSLGAAQAYLTGYWNSPDLTKVVRVMLRNLDLSDEMDRGLARITAPAKKLFQWLRANTLRGSRANIRAHYDLGNDFFEQFLDKTMTYSCGYFERDDSTLEEASIAKIDRVCRKLELRPSDHLLEIGTGWGALAIHAARHYGCRITTTTISDAQYERAKQRIARAGLDRDVEVKKADYRTLSGRYDKIASIEMIEAIGHRQYPLFFDTCRRLLADDGMMLVQAIAIRDDRYEQAKDDTDFIKRYVFPGSCIPSTTALCNAMSRTTDLRLAHLEDITPHYVLTLREWRKRFHSNLDSLRRLGYDETLFRLWDYYLAYCEGGFAENNVFDVQLLFAGPRRTASMSIPSARRLEIPE